MSIDTPTTLKKKEVVLSGIRPTGYLHLGNYVGAIQNFLKMQEKYTCFFFVADWHSLTTHPDTKELKRSTYRVLAEHLAAGIDIQKSTLFVQSQVPEIAELYVVLNTLAYKGELEKTVTFKEKIKLHAENVNAGLLTYPVLQAADILIHRASLVPVGKDQEQHLEMCRNFAQRFNHRYGELFPEPVAFSGEENLIKILSLDGEGKMSKSENQMATIYLSDTDEAIEKKIMRARTDAGPTSPHAAKPPYIENLFTLFALVSTEDQFAFFEQQYQDCRIRYGDFKKALSENMIRFIRPIRERATEILLDESYLHQVIQRGTDAARASAQATIREMRKRIHTDYYFSS